MDTIRQNLKSNLSMAMAVAALEHVRELHPDAILMHEPDSPDGVTSFEVCVPDDYGRWDNIKVCLAVMPND